MSRHRNIRKINLTDELSEDVYGQSLDDVDHYCVSPATEAEFMFKRDDTHHTLSSFMGSDAKIDEEAGSDDEEIVHSLENNYKRPELAPIDQAKLQSCIEKLEDILGDAYDEKTIVDAVLYHRFDVERSIDQLLNKGATPTSQSSKKTTESRTTFRNEYFPNKSYLITTPKKQDATPTPPRESSPFAKNKSSKNSSGSSTPQTASRSQSKEDLLADESVNTPNNSKTPKASKSREVIDVQAELKKRQDGKDLINLVVIGHVDAGKSTLMGHLLYKLGNVSKKAMHKNETESKKSGKGSFAFAWVLDETEEERTRGITMDVAVTMFETKTKLITLMDAPGHRDFIPNMIQGTAQADVAILVVDSRPGEFEAGFEAGGQTREHAILARSLGVGQLVVAINKMDSIDWSKERYDNIVLRLKTFLTRQAGFRESDVYYVPCSGLSGENLIEKAKEEKLKLWYKNDCLVDLIDKFLPPERPIDKPFRFCVSDVYKGTGSFVVSGKVESGCVQNGDRVIAMPAGEAGIMKGLLTRDEPVKFAAAGDHVTASIHGVDMAHVGSGTVICEIENPIKVSARIAARIVVFDTQIPITKGFMKEKFSLELVLDTCHIYEAGQGVPVVFHSQSLTEPATICKLVSILNKNSGEVVQKRPRCLTKQMNAVIEVKFARPICVELYRDNKVLGRFMLRYSGKTIAAGVVTEVK